MEYLTIMVPVDQNDFIMRVVLDGTMTYMRMSYNSTGDYWTIGYCDSQGNPIVSSIKIVPNFPLNFPYTAYDIPKGLLFVRCSKTRVGKDSFRNGDAVLCYAPYTEDV